MQLATTTAQEIEGKISVKKSRRNRYLRLSISPVGEIRLTAPLFASDVAIQHFLASQQDWIRKVLEKLPSKANLQFYSGETFTILDSVWEVVRLNSADSQLKLHLDRQAHKVYVFAHVNTEKEELGKLLRKRLIALARDRITQDVNDLGLAHDFSFQGISIREQKSRWGSCSSSGSLNFNWKILLAPLAVYKYVIVHELSHLKEHNHSAKFWQLVESLQADYRQHRIWLKRNAHLLEIV